MVDKLYNPALARTYGVDEMNKGIKILDHNAQNNDIIILGSSELANSDYIPQNAANVFPTTELKSNVDLVGRAFVQSLANAIKVGALKESFSGKKVVFIISLQWFLTDDVDEKGFKSNFSEIQFYKFLNNSKISDESKAYVCERVSKLLKYDSSFNEPYLYTSRYKKDNLFYKSLLNFLNPYYCLKQKFLELKDKHQALKAVKRFNGTPIREAIDVNWESEKIKAQKMGENACTNNDLYVYDDYYDNYLKGRDLKNMFGPDLDLLSSKEVDDYKLALDIFKQNDVKPYLIFVSTNGFYYDRAGLDREKRLALYDKLVSLASEYGFDYLDLRDKEYEPYFYKDVMHLGWKGWLYVNEKITEHYS